ncbi:uncharacterized protein Z520_07040 [Fonsecaea multimorphosa CBS 102226]|uniref:Cyclochlorotine biosynthesis protein O n=1 Tax=Fonsecaea multimorphosa CBS 102226 TaxID=1442371 RepID=A0A0D2IIW3_9EURO|nr:uncharacterized protein Z520_07040 [Fonsecaea multimorphosa CBS 102226]KIX96926.1 hypothetical protein Z520_07040 [Fonsecaea multimorphosa CBS 102226]
MDCKYQRLTPILEKPRAESLDSCSTLGDLEDLQISLTSGRSVDHVQRLSTVRPFLASNWLWMVHAVLLVTSCTLFTLSITIRSSTLKHVRGFSAWSPAESAVEFNSVRYNITTKGNRFVGAGPEVDKAWREISYDVGDQWIPKSDIKHLEMPKTSLKVNHPETGEEGYRVGMEVFHQLHCINLLRRVTYKEYYEPLGGEFGKGPEELQRHTDHCIEVLRLNIQCNADIGLFTFYMIEGDPLAWPELNSKHVCRNFDQVRQWALEHSVGNMEVLS